MNFVAQVEEHLRDLGTDARRKHPGVKEASERAILQLRSLQTTYVSLVRRASTSSKKQSQNQNQSQIQKGQNQNQNHQHPTTAIFKSQEILRPFLLAANYPDVNYSLLNLVFNAILILLQGDAICDEDFVYVVRVLSIQSNVCCSSFYSVGGGGGGNNHHHNSNHHHHNYKVQKQQQSHGNSGSKKNDNDKNGEIKSSSLPTKNNDDTSSNASTTASTSASASASTSTSTSTSTSVGTISSIGTSIFGMLNLGGGSSNSNTSNNTNNHNNDNNNNNNNNHNTILSSVTGSIGSTITSIGKSTSSYSYSSSTGKTGRTLKEDEALSIRILQTLTMIIDSRSMELTEEVLSQCLAICFTFISSTNHNNSNSSTSGHGGGHGGNNGGHGGSNGNGGHGGSDNGGIGSVRGNNHNKDHEKKNQKGNNGSGNEKLSSVSVSAKKVRGAAIATLRQIISIVFDRAATETAKELTSTLPSASIESKSTEYTSKSTSTTSKKSVKVIASRLFLDLCEIAEFGSGINITMNSKNNDSNGSGSGSGGDNLESQLKEKGSFSQALLGGGISHQRMNPPPRSVCFDLLEMIISQQVGLFTLTTTNNDNGNKNESNAESGIDITVTPSISVDGNNESSNTTSGEPDFSLLLRNRLCPVLSNMLTSEFVIGLDSTDMNDENTGGGVNNSNSSSNRRRRNSADAPRRRGRRRMVGDNPASFTLLMTLTKLAATIITVYGTHSALESSLYSECHVLLISLVKYIKAATEVIRDSHEFEDGFVYSNHTKEEIQQSFHLSSSQRNVMPYASSHVLWRAAITLELLYGLISDNFENLFPLFESRNGSRPSDTLLSVLIEAVTDFAVVVSSNKVGIGSVVEASSIKGDDGEIVEENDGTDDESKIRLRNYSFDIKKIQPIITSRARDIVKSQDEWNDSDIRGYHSGSFPDCDLGAAAWVGFNFVLVAWKSLQLSEKKENDKKILMEGAFASSLALIQHFLRRFPASEIVCRDALSGYSFLAKTLLPICDEGDFQRRLIFTSLCKLSLPSKDNSSKNYDILDHHVAALCLLIQIIHSNFNELMNDWYIILCTIESLNLMSISSSQLSEDGEDGVTAIATAFSEVGRFTTCLSAESIKFFVESLISMSKSKRRLSGFGNKNTFDSPREDQEIDSFRKKIMSYAGQALYMGTGEPESENNDMVGPVKMNNSFANIFRGHVRRKLSKVTTRDDLFPDLPFSLVLLADLIVENSFRFRILNQKVSAYLSDIAACSDSEVIRIFSFDLMSYLISQGLGSNQGEGLSVTKVCSGHTSVDTCFKVELSSTTNSATIEDGLSLYQMPQEDLFAPLCHSINTSSKREAAEIGLQKLKGILELGFNVAGAWLQIIEALSALSGGADNTYIDRSSSEWSLCCTNAFGCLRLIVDDFLDSGDERTGMTRSALLDCCASFGSSQHDVNISLTATGMLWTIADQDDSPASVDHVLAKLAFLASDSRVEVRNCSVNTLFSCIVGCGHRFSKSQWHQCINEIIFGILDAVAVHCNPNEKNSDGNDSSAGDLTTQSRYTVSRHHTRDSTMKQWTTTKVLILQGIERVFRIYFQELLETSVPMPNEDESQWFSVAWEKIVKISYECSIQTGGRETLNLRTAGVDLLSLCCQVSSKVGVVAGDVRVGTNMQVVNGALRSVRVPNKSASTDSSPSRKKHNPATGKTSHELFEYAFGVLTEFNGFLDNNDSMRKANDSFPSSLDNTVLQVLTKLCQGLSQIYDCCKDDELAISNVNNNETRFVELASTITMMASAPGSKYLTQVQRISFELLEKMSLNSSLLAYRSIAALFFSVEETSSGDEAFHEEASKILNGICPKVSHDYNVSVLSVVLDKFVKNGTKHEAGRMMMIAPFIKKALDSTKHAENVPLRGIWITAISFLSMLISTNESGSFNGVCSDLLELLDSCFNSLPSVMHSEMGELLAKITIEADMVLCNPSNSDEDVQDALRIFQKCFSGLCEYTNLERIQSMSNGFLERTTSSDSEGVKGDMEIEVARIVCETLASTSISNDVAVELFPSLCKLMNSQNDSLRKESAELLSKVDVSALMGRVKDAEEQVKSNTELPIIKERLDMETIRANDAEKDVDELRQINSQLMKEVEHLRAEKAKLEQQVAVLSEGSAYV